MAIRSPADDWPPTSADAFRSWMESGLPFARGRLAVLNAVAEEDSEEKRRLQEIVASYAGALRSLMPLERRVITLRREKGLTVRETRLALHISERSVQRLERRALQRMADFLQER